MRRILNPSTRITTNAEQCHIGVAMVTTNDWGHPRWERHWQNLTPPVPSYPVPSLTCH